MSYEEEDPCMSYEEEVTIHACHTREETYLPDALSELLQCVHEKSSWWSMTHTSAPRVRVVCQERRCTV